MKKTLLIAAILEISYLTLSFVIAQMYGQWSYGGEIIRTGLRVISIVSYGYFYQKYFYKANRSFKAKEILTPQFVAAILLFIFFAVAYTNAKNEAVLWQLVFVISGLAAGLREELFYRGIVQQSLQIKYDYKIALSAATLLFMLSHIQYIYHGQIRALMFITLAGIIFGSIFIYTGSIVFTAIIHSLYDAVLSIDMVPFRLSDGLALPIMFLIMLAFLIIINKKLYRAKQTDKTDDSNQDNLSLGL
jgi:membrane protease YdiL (CAAX protease family)